MILPWEMTECFPFLAAEMEKRLKTPLVKQFPTLAFARKADRWLATLKHKSIEQQFTQRCIVENHVSLLSSCKGFVAVTALGDGIVIYIDGDLGPKEKLFTLGHEIGHTFHLDLAKTPIKNTVPDEREYEWGNLERGQLYYLIEDFADTFAEKWLAINGKEKIEAWRQRRNKKVQATEQG